jgi:hypothetical protein
VRRTLALLVLALVAAACDGSDDADACEAQCLGKCIGSPTHDCEDNCVAACDADP